MRFFRSTQEHTNYWTNRKIDWKTQYFDTWNHPHRYLITGALSTFPWLSLMEIGCGAGANLANIIKHLKGKQVGGIDLNPEAIEFCNKTFTGGFFKVNSADDVMMSDRSVDVVLSDMTLIYVGPKDIDRYISEIKRITRNRVVLCEFHSSSWFERLKIKWSSGYNTYDYKKLLKKHGFYDIQSYKIPPEGWPGIKDSVRHIFIARVPKRG